jgi:ankyrin repeat protein
VDARDLCGRTPLHRAAAEDHGQAAEVLLAAGAVASLVDDFRETPLDKAERDGYAALAELLRAAMQ